LKKFKANAFELPFLIGFGARFIEIFGPVEVSVCIGFSGVGQSVCGVGWDRNGR